MRKTKFLTSIEVSALDVLEIIRDRYRHAARLDPEVERDIDLTLNSTIAEWRDSCDLLPASRLWPTLNGWFGVSFCEPEWMGVLEPAKSKTLRVVCELIASRASRPTIRPFRVAGIECLSTGTFLTMRTLLVQAGVPVQHVRPSSSLVPYARRYSTVFIAEFGKFAPGALPVPIIEQATAYKACITAILLGFLILMVSFKWHAVFIAAALLFAIGLVGVRICSKHPPKAVRFGTLTTFRTLTEAVLRHYARQTQPL